MFGRHLGHLGDADPNYRTMYTEEPEVHFLLLQSKRKPVCSAVPGVYSQYNWAESHIYLSRSHKDAGCVGVAASSVRSVTVVNGLTLVSILHPSGQALANV